MEIEIPDGTLIFEDRREAGRILAQQLLGYRDELPIVLGLPRGGVVVAYEIARILNAPLDVVVARKLGVPGHEELGMGAIAPGGVRVLDEMAVQRLGITGSQIQTVAARETVEMNRRLRLYRGERPLPDLKNRTVILVDDGLATGVTAEAAIRFVRQHQPKRLVLAVPVCAAETAARLQAEVDALICACTPPDFGAVAVWYRHFEQTTDQEVIDLLESAALDVTG